MDKANIEAVDISQQSFDEVIHRFGPLVHKISSHIHAKLPPHVQLDDLAQAGMIGLMMAARQHDPEQGSFHHYATIRIRGAILDELRKSDWAPAYMRKKYKGMLETVRILENHLGRNPTEQEIAHAMGLRLEAYHELLIELNVSQTVISLDALHEESGKDTHSALVASSDSFNENNLTHLKKTMQHLPLRENLIISLYYDEGLSLKEIAGVLQISESRVSQLLNQAMLRIKAKVVGDETP